MYVLNLVFFGFVMFFGGISSIDWLSNRYTYLLILLVFFSLGGVLWRGKKGEGLLNEIMEFFLRSTNLPLHLNSLNTKSNIELIGCDKNKWRFLHSAHK